MEIDVYKLIPRRGWALVLADARSDKTEGGIIKPSLETQAEKMSVWTGTLARLGPGERNAALGLENGLRVAYRSFLKHAHSFENGEKWESGETKQFFLINSDDLLMAVTNDVKIGVLSSKANIHSTE